MNAHITEDFRRRLTRAAEDNGGVLGAVAIAQLMADAFEEGYGLGYSDCVWQKGHEPRDRNPYRSRP